MHSTKTKSIEKTIKYKEHQLHYHCFGQGPKTLLALHGFADRGELFGRLAPALASHYRIIAPDLPFHGNTNWQKNSFRPKEIKEVLDLIFKQEKVAQFSLMGHSMGGRLILALAPWYDERIEELYLLAPAGFQGALSDSPWLFPKPMRQFLKLLTSRPKVIMAVFSLGKRLGIINRGTYRFLEQQIGVKERRLRLFDCWISLAHFPIRLRPFKAMIREQNIPTRFLYGKTDYITPAKYGRRFIEDLPQASLQMVEDGHYLLREPLCEVLDELLKE